MVISDDQSDKSARAWSTYTHGAWFTRLATPDDADGDSLVDGSLSGLRTAAVLAVLLPVLAW